MKITPQFFANNQDFFQGPARTSTYVILEELLTRGYSVEMPYWPALPIRFIAPDKTLRLIKGIVNSQSLALSRFMSVNKLVTYGLAEELGLPVPDTEAYSSVDEASAFWDRHEGSCVLKVANGKGGKGVRTVFRDKESFIMQAQNMAAKTLLLLQEKIVVNRDLRLLFIGGHCVAATVRKPFTVIGDGVSTIEGLVAAENTRRQQFNTIHHQSMALTIFDIQKTLERIDATIDDVLQLGEEVEMSLANISDGGIAEDVTDIIHKDFVSAASKLDEALKCPILAIDFLCDNPAVSFEDNQKVVFLETNTEPGIDLHMYPHAGIGRNVAARYVDYVLTSCDR